jgi:Calcium binding
MYDIEDIPSIPDQTQRIEAVTVDCYGQAEELASFEVYFTDAMRFPFAATWRDPDELERAEPVDVLAVDSVDERRGILLSVERLQHSGKRRRLPAEQVWADDEDGANAVILNDYRYWVNELNGLRSGFG